VNTDESMTAREDVLRDRERRFSVLSCSVILCRMESEDPLQDLSVNLARRESGFR
jgi:hypothetical protein